MKHLIIGSGGMVGIKFIGILKSLSDQGKLNDIETISTASIGSIIGTFFVLYKGNMNDIARMMIESEPPTKLVNLNIKTFIKKYGFIDGEALKEYFKNSGLKDITFRELYQLNPIKLIISTYDITNSKTVYMSIDTTPDLDVLDAIIRSISVPLLFTPVDGRYIDGSFAEINPGGCMIGLSDVFELRCGFVKLLDEKKPSLFTYILRILYAVLISRISYDDFPRITVEADFDIFEFSMSREKKEKLYLEGYSIVLI